MDTQDDTASLIENLLSEDPEVSQLASPSSKAYLLATKYQISRADLCAYFDIANSSITRAKQATEQGFDAGITGRHQLLSTKDEHILERWIQFLVEVSETVYTSTLIQLVCTILFQ